MIAIRDALHEYVNCRRALGTQYREPAVTLAHFVDFLESEGAEFITTPLALRWAMLPEQVQRATWARRLSMVRKFAAWLSMLDTRTQVPPKRLLNCRHRRRKPHIFTDQEVGALMNLAARLPSPLGLRALTYVTLIGILAATGLRPGEALALDRPDVDLQTGVLTVRQSKFGKSRFVPLQPSTRQALERYEQRRSQTPVQRQSDAFLIAESGRRLVPCTCRRTFAKLSRAIGLRAAAQGRRIGRGPRLQDLRHSFATRTLIDWYRAGLDVHRELPKLSTYLGHAGVEHTYWYIDAVPELLQLACGRLASRLPKGSQQ